MTPDIALPSALAISETPIDVRVGLNSPAELRRLASEALRQNGALKNTIDDQAREARNRQRELLIGMIDVCDALDRSINNRSPNLDPVQRHEQLLRNVQAIRRLLLQKMAAMGVTSVSRTAATHDAQLDDIDSYVLRPELSYETVLIELLACYQWSDLVLRRGRVVVSMQEEE